MAPSLLTPQDQVNIRIVSGVFCAIAALVTGFRLYVRGKNWWFDDWCALIALIGTLGAKGCQIAVTYGVMRVTGPGSVSAKIGLNYILAITYVLELWFARISILYSIIRITPFTHWAKRLHWVVLFFALCALTYLFMFVGYCERFPAWKQAPLKLCFITKYISYFQIATALITDTILVVIPFIILRLLTSLPETRKTLRLLFTATILMTVTQVVQTSMTLRQATGSIFASLTVGFIAVVMCSLPVVVMASFGLFGSSTAASKEINDKPKFNLSNEIGFRTSFSDESRTKPEEPPAPSPSDSATDVKGEQK